MTVARVGGRVLLLDDADRVLLIHERIEDGSTHWITPGGGVEPGEHPREAAIREAMEETGLPAVIAADAQPVLTTRRTWSWAGVVYDQVDHFFVAPAVEPGSLRPHALTEMERQTLVGMRWWSLAELRETTERVVPEQLAEVLAGLLAGGNLGRSWQAGPQ